MLVRVTGSVAYVETPILFRLQRFTSAVLQAYLKKDMCVSNWRVLHAQKIPTHPGIVASHQSVSLIRTANSPCSTRGNITEVMMLSLQLEFSHHCGQPWGLEIREAKCTHSIWIKARFTEVTGLAFSSSLQGRSRLSPKPASDWWATAKMPVQITCVIIVGRVNNGSRQWQ